MFNIHDLTKVTGTAVVGRIGSICGRMIFIHFFIKENFYMNDILFSFESNYLIKTRIIKCKLWKMVKNHKSKGISLNRINFFQRIVMSM